MNTSDHDLLIKLATQMDQVLAEISKLGGKLDQVQVAEGKQDQSIRDLEASDRAIIKQLRDQEFRIATLEQQVGTLTDNADDQAKLSEALQKESKKHADAMEKRTKWVVFAMSVVSFIIAMLPKIALWASTLLSTLAANPVPLIQAFEVVRWLILFL